MLPTYNAEFVDKLLLATLGITKSPITVFLFTLHTHSANEPCFAIRQDPCSGFEERPTLVYFALAASLAVAIVAQARVDWLLPFFTPIIPLPFVHFAFAANFGHALQALAKIVRLIPFFGREGTARGKRTTLDALAPLHALFAFSVVLSLPPHAVREISLGFV